MNSPIGVFDSGYGGLTILRELVNELPQYNYLYLGDNARSPYGTRSFETVYRYTLQCVEWLLKQGCPLVILACNTASAKALRTIQQTDLQRINPYAKVLGVIRPTTEVIGQYSSTNNVGILATKGTVQSASYKIEIEKFFPDVTVEQEACPMWVPLVENNEHRSPGADYFVKENIDNLFARNPLIDTVLLGCTHYPLLKDKIELHLPPGVKLITQGSIVAHSLTDYLTRHSEVENRLATNRKRAFYTTDDVADFNSKASVFFGEEVAARHTDLRWQQPSVKQVTNTMEEYRIDFKKERKRQVFEQNFTEIAFFLLRFNRFPEKTDNLKLYNWMTALINEHKENRLDQQYIDKLNSIGFIWSKREFNWYEKAIEVKTLLVEQNKVPTYDVHITLYHWLRVQLNLLSKQKLSDDKKDIIEEIKILIEKITRVTTSETVMKISAREAKWIQKFNELAEYRKQNPKSWPQVEAAGEKEKKLGIWCQDLRSRYRKHLLEDTWKEKLLSIGFNFEGRLDNWKERFEELSVHILTHHEVPNVGNSLYVWARLQYKTFDELSAEKQQMLSTIKFLQFFEERTWEKKYAEIYEFIILYKKTPTKKSNAELYHWLTVQRAKYRSNQLADTEREALLSLGIDLNPKEAWNDTWNLKYEALKEFRENHLGRWPSFFSKGIEKQLYQWCQAQRQVYARTAKNRKRLSQDRIDKLNKIDFHWSLDELIEKSWEKNFQKLSDFVSQNKTIVIPATLNGKVNALYTWFRRQRKLIEENKLPINRIDKLKDLGLM